MLGISFIVAVALGLYILTSLPTAETVSHRLHGKVERDRREQTDGYVYWETREDRF